MEEILAASGSAKEILTEQFRVADVTDRELTGVGFFTTFCVPPGAPRLGDRELLHFADVIAEIEGLQHGAGFALHVQEGAIQSLEGFSYDEPWPNEITNFQVFLPQWKELEGGVRVVSCRGPATGDKQNDGEARPAKELDNQKGQSP